MTGWKEHSLIAQGLLVKVFMDNAPINVYDNSKQNLTNEIANSFLNPNFTIYSDAVLQIQFQYQWVEYRKSIPTAHPFMFLSNFGSHNNIDFPQTFYDLVDSLFTTPPIGGFSFEGENGVFTQYFTVDTKGYRQIFIDFLSWLYKWEVPQPFKNDFINSDISKTVPGQAIFLATIKTHLNEIPAEIARMYVNSFAAFFGESGRLHPSLTLKGSFVHDFVDAMSAETPPTIANFLVDTYGSYLELPPSLEPELTTSFATNTDPLQIFATNFVSQYKSSFSKDYADMAYQAANNLTPLPPSIGKAAFLSAYENSTVTSNEAFAQGYLGSFITSQDDPFFNVIEPYFSILNQLIALDYLEATYGAQGFVKAILTDPGNIDTYLNFFNQFYHTNIIKP